MTIRIRLAVVASEINEITWNSRKIRTYNSVQGHSIPRSSSLVSIESAYALCKPISH